MIWIHRMPSVADHLYMKEMMEQRSESANGVYSVHLFNNLYNLLALVEQIFTQQHIFLSPFFYIEAYVVTIVAKIAIVKAT